MPSLPIVILWLSVKLKPLIHFSKNVSFLYSFLYMLIFTNAYTLFADEKIKQMIVNSRPKPDDFQILKTIGSGGQFGEVKLVRRKHTKKVYAMKILPKTKMVI